MDIDVICHVNFFHAPNIFLLRRFIRMHFPNKYIFRCVGLSTGLVVWYPQGKVEVTISRGRIVWRDGKLNVAPGSGRYITMPPFSYLFEGIDKAEAQYLASLHAPVQRITASSS